MAIIPARAGSTRLPGKNKRVLCGKPMVAWTIEAALTCGAFHRVIVSTDDNEIVEICQDYGCEVDKRPGFLATAKASVYDVVRYMLVQPTLAGIDQVALLQPTSPLRTARDIFECYRGRAGVHVWQSCEAGKPRIANGAIYHAQVEYWCDLDFSFDTSAHVKSVFMPADHSVDINTIEDFHRAEDLLNKMLA